MSAEVWSCRTGSRLLLRACTLNLSERHEQRHGNVAVGWGSNPGVEPDGGTVRSRDSVDCEYAGAINVVGRDTFIKRRSDVFRGRAATIVDAWQMAQTWHHTGASATVNQDFTLNAGGGGHDRSGRNAATTLTLKLRDRRGGRAVLRRARTLEVTNSMTASGVSRLNAGTLGLLSQRRRLV